MPTLAPLYIEGKSYNKNTYVRFLVPKLDPQLHKLSQISLYYDYLPGSPLNLNGRSEPASACITAAIGQSTNRKADPEETCSQFSGKQRPVRSDIEHHANRGNSNKIIETCLTFYPFFELVT